MKYFDMKQELKKKEEGIRDLETKIANEELKLRYAYQKGKPTKAIENKKRKYMEQMRELVRVYNIFQREMHEKHRHPKLNEYELDHEFRI